VHIKFAYSYKQLVLVLCYETAARIQDAKDSVVRVARRSGYSCYIKIPHTIMCIPAANPLSFFLKGVLKKPRPVSCSLKRCIGFLLACEFEALFVLVSLRLLRRISLYICAKTGACSCPAQENLFNICVCILCLIVSKCGAALRANESGTHISVNHLFPACRENTVSQNKVNFEQCS
jgi:hypothetical protein